MFSKKASSTNFHPVQFSNSEKLRSRKKILRFCQRFLENNEAQKNACCRLLVLTLFCQRIVVHSFFSVTGAYSASKKAITE